MSIDRRSFLLLAAGACVIGGCGSESGMSIPFVPASNPTPETNVDVFMRHLTDGSKGFMNALAEMDLLVGQKEQAEELEKFLKSAPDTWDAKVFSEAAEVANKAALPADAEITVSKVKGTSHVIGAWAFGTYGGFTNKETYKDAKNVVKQKPMDPKTRDAIETARGALDILPSHIETGTTIIEKTASFMSKKGIAQPDPDEIYRIISKAVPGVEREEIEKIFG